MQHENNDHKGKDNPGRHIDENENRGNLGNQDESQKINSGSHASGSEWENEEHAQSMRSDSDDFNDSGLDTTSGKKPDGEREIKSRTFNEDEETWQKEQQTSETKDDALATNDDTDSLQYGSGRTGNDEERNASSHGNYNDNEPNRYSRENDRRNSEELE